MREEEKEGLQFEIKHKCGHSFKMDTASIIEKFDIEAPLKCPICFEIIGKEPKKALLDFSRAYKRLVDLFHK